jgi:hypothetical protein
MPCGLVYFPGVTQKFAISDLRTEGDNVHGRSAGISKRLIIGVTRSLSYDGNAKVSTSPTQNSVVERESEIVAFIPCLRFRQPPPHRYNATPRMSSPR